MHATIGIALFPGHSAEAERLLRYATKAVIQARRAADDCLVYVPESEQASRRRLMLGHRLQRSIDENELLLFCQPKVSLVNDCVCGAEALVRWRHPEFGMIPPAEFVTLAEHTGFIKPLTDWVLRTAVQENHAWSHEGDVNLPIAVNLSVHNLRDAELVGRVRDLIETWGLPPDRLHLELTESALMQDPAGALKVLTALHDMGLQLFIDDFGTGYSSLGYLQRLPVDAIKIDKSFVEDLPTSVDAASIVRSTIELAHNLGKIVVAEGVEDGDTLEQLRALGCDVVQGYYISKPMPVEAFPDWLRESPWALGQCSTQPPPSGP